MSRVPPTVALRTKTAPVDNCRPAGTTAGRKPTTRTARTADGAVLTTWTTDGAVLTTWAANGAMLNSSMLSCPEISRSGTAPVRRRPEGWARSTTVATTLLMLSSLNLDDHRTDLIAHRALVGGKDRRIG